MVPSVLFTYTCTCIHVGMVMCCWPCAGHSVQAYTHTHTHTHTYMHMYMRIVRAGCHLVAVAQVVEH